MSLQWQPYGCSVPCFVRGSDGWTGHLSQVRLHLRPAGATWAWPDGTIVTLRFSGSQSARLRPVEPVPGRKPDWGVRRRGGKAYAVVRYDALWPGIDLLFRAEGPALKYEFRVAPGADPSRIQLEWEGVERLELDGEGNLLLVGRGWTLTDLAPIAWQPAAVHLAAPEGEGRRSAVEGSDGPGRPVAAGYAIGKGASFGFTLPEGYDPERPLVIDPELHHQ
jgi:hypothetical protein